MRSSRKNSASTKKSARTVKSGTAEGLADLDSAKAKRMQKAMGNQGLAGKMGQAGGSRDELLAFICQRLRTVQGVQNKELGQMNNERDWFREVARGNAGYHLPEPTRWHETARLYHRAAEALCHGNLGRGGDLVRQAMDAEQAAMDNVPRQVQDQLEGEEKQVAEAPAVLEAIPQDTGCPTREEPKDIDIAHEILRVVAVMPQTPPIPIRKKFWWEEEEEEEEEQEAEKG